MQFYKIIVTLLVVFLTNIQAKIQDDKLAQLQEVINESKLLPTPAGVGGNIARFGESVSIDGNRALIGSPRALEHGVAYIFDYDGTSWNETQFFFPDDGFDAGNRFGTAVSLQGNRAVISDKFNRVNGAFQAGAVYVYELNNGIWQLSQKLIASDAGSSDKFGSSVSLSGDRILVGATDYDDVTNGNGSGAAYLFDYDGTSWQESVILTATGGSSGDGLGNAVSLDSDKALVGAKNFDDNNNGINTGSAYLFELTGANWSQTKQFSASDGVDNDGYGIDVGISAGRVLIGASDTDEGFSTAGSVYVYEFDGTTWQETKILAPDATNGNRFGSTVSIENNRMLIGAKNGETIGSNTGSAYIFDYDVNLNQWNFTHEIAADDITTSNFFASALDLSGDTVIVGNFNDRDNGSQSGASYVFELNGTWQQSQKLATQGAADDNFGYAVSLDGNRALIGAPYDDNSNGLNAGNAYIFDYINGQWSAPIKLQASEYFQNFGMSVSLSGNTAIIGANRIEFAGGGQAYIFEFDGSTWNQTALLESGVVGNDEFGFSVSINADRALVGALFGAGNVAVSGLVYVYEKDINGWQPAGTLIASDGASSDAYGVSVSLLGDRALVGAYTKDDDINNRSRAGAAYIYDYDVINDLWVETKLQALVTSSSGFFGFDVELGQDRAVIGATGNSQTAYVFDYDSGVGSWSGIELVTSSNSSSQFGYSVSIDNNRVLIGAPNTTINTEQFVGAAYQFDFDGSLWSETKTYTANDGAIRSFYGWSVALSGKRALFGSYKDDDRGTDSGSVYTINDVDVLFTDGFEN